jgi:hypothetical protein
MDESKYLERLSSTGRNEPCPCGSGKKYKKCHMAADEAKRHGDSVKLEEEMAAAADLPDDEKADDAAQKKKPVMAKKQGMGPGYRGSKGKSSPTLPRRSAV